MEKILFEPPGLESSLMVMGLPGGGSRSQDRSPYAQPGAITGAVWQRLPNGLWHLSFDGVDDSVDCGNHPSLNITDKLTVKLWTLPETQNVSLATIVGKDQSGGRSFAYGLSSSYRLWGQQSGAFIGFSNGVAAAGRWHQLVYAYDAAAAAFAFYIDGVLDRTVGSAPAIASSSTNLYLGKMSYVGAEGYYKGGVALVEVQRQCWLPLEVQNSFNREKQWFGVW